MGHWMQYDSQLIYEDSVASVQSEMFCTQLLPSVACPHNGQSHYDYPDSSSSDQYFHHHHEVRGSTTLRCKVILSQLFD